MQCRVGGRLFRKNSDCITRFDASRGDIGIGIVRVARRAHTLGVQRPEQQREGKRSGVAPLTALIASFAIVLQAAQWRAAAEAAPSAPERIAATLVRWGVAVEGVAPPVDPEARARHEQLLSSDIGEERVRAARWLAARGVRSAGARIVDAMNDPGTMRPCQLAHSLGSLGDERWVD